MSSRYDGRWSRPCVRVCVTFLIRSELDWWGRMNIYACMCLFFCGRGGSYPEDVWFDTNSIFMFIHHAQGNEEHDRRTGSGSSSSIQHNKTHHPFDRQAQSLRKSEWLNQDDSPSFYAHARVGRRRRRRMERRGGGTKSIQSALKFFRNCKKDQVKKIPDLAVSGFSADPPLLFGLSPPVMMASVDGPSRKGWVLTRQREHMCVWITRESSPPSNKVDKNGENVKKRGTGVVPPKWRK